ncbi:Hpt domain-containing protein [Iodobacter arcticus]|uniref:histidine kinase n=1 Tax=Iodobacter arcticus TaxID=590593 RepID=A0ABW2QW07_9NEIS
MSAHTEFDLGSLVWVKSEIEQTLQKASQALAQFGETKDSALLKHARTFLHQAYGAVQMVELTGLARFCEEIEQTLASDEISPDTLAIIQRAIAEASHYLEQIAAGAPNQPLRLLGSFKKMAALRQASESGAELFFPHLADLELPKGLPVRTVAAADASAFIRLRRQRFEAVLLSWIGNEPAAAGVMAKCLAEIAATQSLAISRHFWWAAAGLLDGLSRHQGPLDLNIDLDLKQLILRLNMQLRRLSEGSGKVAERLYRDILYALLMQETSSTLALALRKGFALESLLPGADSDLLSPESALRVLLARSLREELDACKEGWGRISSGQFERLNAFMADFEPLSARAEPLAIPGLDQLWPAITVAVQRLHDHAPSDADALEVATALLLIDNCLVIYPLLADDFPAQAEAMCLRLLHPTVKNELPQLDEITRQAQERLLQAQLAHEMRSNLQGVEDILDGWFRKPDSSAELNKIDPSLRQIQGALVMLEKHQAVELLQRCQQRIEQFTQSELLLPAQEDLELLAEGLSCLGFYIDSIAQNRDEPASLLVMIDKLAGSVQPDAAQNELEQLEEEPQLDAEPAPQHVKPLPDPSRPLPASDAAVDAELLEVFLEEAAEVLASISEQILVCQQTPHDREALTVLRRSFHTLKGSGRMVGLNHLAQVAWAIEQLLNKLMQIEKTATPELLQLLAQAHTAFATWVQQLGRDGVAQVEGSDLIAAAEQLKAHLDVVSAPFEDSVSLEGEQGASDEVTIGTVTVSSSLFSLFRNEAAQYLQTLQGGKNSHPSAYLLAAHTLGGIASTAGFRSLGELAYTLEHAVQQLGETVIGREPALDQAVERIGSMLKSIFALEAPGFAEAEILALQNLQAETYEISLDESIEPEGVAIELGHGLAESEPEAENEALLLDSSAAEFAVPDVVEADDIAGVEPEAALDELAEPLDFSLEGPLDLAIKPELVSDTFTEQLAVEVGLELDAFKEHEPLLDGLDQPAGLANDAFAESLIEEIDSELPDAFKEHEQLLDGMDQLAGPACDVFAEPLVAEIDSELDSFKEHEQLLDGLDQPAELANDAFAESLIEEIDSELSDVFKEHELLAEALVPVNEFEQQGEAEPLSSEVAETQEVAEPVVDELKDESEALSPLLDGLLNQPDDLDSADEEEQLVSLLDMESLTPFEQLLDKHDVQRQSELDGLQTDDIDEQLLPVFIEEADELMQQISGSLRGLRVPAEVQQESSALKRDLHTFKGSARMAGAMRMGEVAHQMESRLLAAGNHYSAALLDALDADFDLIQTLADELKGVKQPVVVAKAAPLNQVDVESGTTIRVKSELMDQLVNQAGEVSIARSRIDAEMITMKASLLDLTENVNRLRSQLREMEIQAESQMQAKVKEQESHEANFDPLEFDRFTRLQEVTRFIAESVNDVATIQQNLLKNHDDSTAALSQQARMTKELQQSLMRVRMVPFSSLSDRLYRLTRQTGKDVGKKVNLELRGGRVEVDRGVLDQMMSPFEHMLRNAIDHGLETTEQRVALGKSEFGEVQVEVRQEGNELVLVLKDDGKGLDLETLRAKGVEKGLLAAHASDQMVTELIFEPGISTASSLTALSGRGIGMDVVKNKLGDLGGRIDVSSQAGVGTTFTIYLPLTLAVTQVVLVKAGGQQFAIPSGMIEQVQEIKLGVLERIYESRFQEWMDHRYPFAYFPRLLGDAQSVPEQKRYNTILLLRSGTGRMALHVDELLRNQEVVVKTIGPQLARIPGVTGATVLGNGDVVMIMNPLLLLAHGETRSTTAESAAPETLKTTPLVMVVDDSLTVRKITGRLLAREGFQVLTAKDGVDALQQLSDVTPDVMLVDIEMPRMDGFELTRNVRANEGTRQIPIIMITSRTADKHKNYAFELGVNAFLGKPYQEEELLSQIRGFIQA